ncbi:hypothetical protein PVAP13_5KG178807 [Panicum virgatum]|uniref:Uncharacterized protein n=1 Tax=Panicum virgatum TaxID=38727 RepID=A0A8T0SJG6_PANVG|nr:hypothetical protein PVAP13_5KG178807 [Panicum virgatum]KAG2596697.1 hypothetical protein PVAP13_5KG178807 [Panicum virgatum]
MDCRFGGALAASGAACRTASPAAPQLRLGPVRDFAPPPSAPPSRPGDQTGGILVGDVARSALRRHRSPRSPPPSPSHSILVTAGLRHGGSWAPPPELPTSRPPPPPPLFLRVVPPDKIGRCLFLRVVPLPASLPSSPTLTGRCCPLVPPLSLLFSIGPTSMRSHKSQPW